MKLLLPFYHIHLIIFFTKFIQILNIPLLTKYKEKNTISQNATKSSKKKLSNEICTIKNCVLCDNRNECIKCKEGFEIYKNRCYSKSCEIYGFCKVCDEYDCLKCMKGYKLHYGICDQQDISRKNLYFIVVASFVIILIIVYICIRYNKLSKLKISTGQVIKFLHPKTGFYQLHYETENGSLDHSDNKILSGSPSSPIHVKPETESPIVDKCIICGNKNKYAIADCGCSICFEHYKIIKKGKKINCNVHKTLISSNISFKMVEKSNIKGNALKKLGLDKCPICKINDATQSFNCNCTTKVCEKCFNDNIYVFKYNKCPGCGKEYIPIKKNTRRWVKSVEVNIHRTKSNGKNTIENGNKEIEI